MQKAFMEVIDKEILPNLPDTVETRKIKRLNKGVKGERLSAKAQLDDLENPVKNVTELHLKTRTFFENQLQIIMDFYQDILDNTSKGPAVFSKVSLLSVSGRANTDAAEKTIKAMMDILKKGFV